MRVEKIPLDSILVDQEFNCRGASITKGDVLELGKDMRERGLVSPIVVMPTPNAEQPYRLIAGFRRYHAALWHCKWPEIDAVINETIVSEADAISFNIAENLHRSDLDIKQEARAIQKLMQRGLSSSEAAEKIGKSTTWVDIRFKLLSLPEDIQDDAAGGLYQQKDIKMLYHVLVSAGRDKCLIQARLIKEAREKGSKQIKQVKTEKFLKSKKIRTGSQMQEMMAHIGKHFGFDITTRSLAWAAGEISYEELFNDLEALAKECEIDYEPIQFDIL